MYTRNVYSGDGATARNDPLPMSKGLIYSDPFPGGGTYIYICLNSKQEPSSFKKTVLNGTQGDIEGSGDELIPNACWQGLFALQHQ